MKINKYPILMIPGPSQPYPEAQMNLLQPILPHYGSDWIKIYYRLLEKLKILFGTKQGVHIYPGAGTAVMEMGLSTIIEKGDNILFINKGFFIDRFRYIAEIHGAETHQVGPEDYGERVNLDELRYIVEVVKPKAVVVVHSETSTGVLEDIENISKIIPKDTFLLVDCISSFGALKLNCDGWGVDLCVGYSSKALGGINGVTPFMVSEKLWNYCSLKNRNPHSFSLDLGIWRKYVDDWKEHPYPISISTPLIFALEKAVDRVLTEGIENVQERHYEVSNIVKDWVERNGLESLPRRSHASPTVTVFKLPKNVSYKQVINRLRDEYGIFVSSTWLIGINGVRIGHMGVTADFRYVLPTIKAIETVLNDLL